MWTQKISRWWPSLVVADLAAAGVAGAFPSATSAALGAHVVLALALGVAVGARTDRRLGAVAAALAGALPGLGALATAALLAARAGVDRGDTPRTESVPVGGTRAPTILVSRRPLLTSVRARAILGERGPARAPRRLEALRALDAAPAEVAVPLLREALGDDVDDVRLLAFARLERRRDAAELAHRRLRALPATGLGARGALQRAKLGLGLVQLGFVDGGAREEVLAAARADAERACALDRESAVARFVRGRVYEAAGDHARALASYEDALACGYVRGAGLLAVAACELRLRRLARVRAAVRGLDDGGASSLARGLREQWR